MMAHFAQIDDSNIVINVTVVADSDCQDGNGDESESVGIAFMKGLLGSDTNWVQTSYNTKGGVHYAPNSNTPDGGVALRKNYAGIGYTYDSGRDAFIEPKPFPSWLLDEDTCIWNAPTPYPDDDDKPYGWDEDTTSWKEIEI